MVFDFETEVLVVGTGPAGAVAALSLATQGIDVHAISKANWLANSPRAHITNQRAVEVLRGLGVEDEAVLYATPWDQMGDTTFATSLSGPEIARLGGWGAGHLRNGDFRAGSPCEVMDLPQSYLEPILVNRAASRGARFSFNTEYIGHEQDADGVTVQLLDRLSNRRFTARAKYLIGADGGRSRVREDLGVVLEGEMGREATAYVLFRADLSRLVAHRPSVLYWLMRPDARFGEIGMGLLRAIRPWNEWIVGWGFEPASGPPDLSEAAVVERIREYVGDPALEVEVDSTSTWFVNEAFAKTYAVGRVFLMGDAVHQHPPSSALGSNTCIQDADNLAWKLAYVLRGFADRSLLDSYESERAPIGEQIVRRANQSRHDYAKLKEAFSTDGQGDPVEAGLRKVSDPGQAGINARRMLDEGLMLKETEYNAQGTAMNARYISTAVLPDPNSGEEVWLRHSGLYLQATTRPGAKIPHAWLVDAGGRRASTLDVVGTGKFTLLTGISGRVWKSAAEDLHLPFLRALVIGDGPYFDPYFEWARLREVDEGGAILVRPDGYVAWRHTDAAGSTGAAISLLSTAISALTGGISRHNDDLDNNERTLV